MSAGLQSWLETSGLMWQRRASDAPSPALSLCNPVSACQSLEEDKIRSGQALCS